MNASKYEVYFTDGTTHSFNGGSVLDVWIRGMSYGVVTNKPIEIKHIVNHATAEIFSDFLWDVSFSLKDTALTTVVPVLYTEEEVREKLRDYCKYIGAPSPTHVMDWFSRNRKLK